MALRTLLILSLATAALAAAPPEGATLTGADASTPATCAAGAACNTFAPTAEWQEVPDGAELPPGLDVKMNLKSGKQFARLTGAAAAAPPPLEAVHAAEGAAAAPELSPAQKSAEMHRILLALPQPPPELGDEAALRKLTPAQRQELVRRVWKRRQAALASTQENVVTEFDTMKQLIAHVSAEDAQTHVLLRALEDLEYMVTKTDNARDLHKADGLAPLVLRLRHPEDAVRAHAAWALGTAVKLDSLVQGQAISLGAPKQLMQLAQSDASEAARVKALYAIGSLVRDSKSAQEHLHGIGGFDALRGLLPEGPRAVQKKVLALVTDILTLDAGTGSATVAANLRSEAWRAAVISLPAIELGEDWDANEALLALLEQLQPAGCERITPLVSAWASAKVDDEWRDERVAFVARAQKLLVGCAMQQFGRVSI